MPSHENQRIPAKLLESPVGEVNKVNDRMEYRLLWHSPQVLTSTDLFPASR